MLEPSVLVVTLHDPFGLRAPFPEGFHHKKETRMWLALSSGKTTLSLYEFVGNTVEPHFKK